MSIDSFQRNRNGSTDELPDTNSIAPANLHKFEIVGCLEYFEDSHKQFHNRFGIKLKKLKKNRNPKSQIHIKSSVTKEIEEEITRICQPDLEVYNYAVETFVNQR